MKPDDLGCSSLREYATRLETAAAATETVAVDPAAAEPEPEPNTQSRWVKPIAEYVRRETSFFAPARYG
jgi:hypothetical protein